MRPPFGRRPAGSSELSHLLGVPLLVTLPVNEKLVRDQHDDDDLLVAKLVSEEEEGGRSTVLLVASATPREGLAATVARLGRALALNGYRAMVISADLEKSKLHKELGLSLGLGLTDLLEVLAQTDEAELAPELLERAVSVVLRPEEGGQEKGELLAICAGTKPKNPRQLLTGRAVEALGPIARSLEMDYVLIEAPPLLSDIHPGRLSQAASGTLLVARPDRLRLRQAKELGVRLGDLAAPPLGLLAFADD